MTARAHQLPRLLAQFQASSDRASRALAESDLDGLAALLDDRDRLIREMEPLLGQLRTAGAELAPLAQLLAGEERASMRILADLAIVRDEVRTELEQLDEVSARSARYQPGPETGGTIDLTR